MNIHELIMTSANMFLHSKYEKCMSTHRNNPRFKKTYYKWNINITCHYGCHSNKRGKTIFLFEGII